MTESPPIILASSSIYRKQQLDSLKLLFSTLNPDIDEQAKPNETASNLVLRLATAKASKVKAQKSAACVIGSDQVCVFAGKIYGEPGNRQKAMRQLKMFSAERIEFLTALCVIDVDGEVQTHIDQTVVQFRALSSAEIIRYIDKEQPFDCAGSFKVEGLGISLFDQVSSNDPTALMGLPLIKLCAFLRQAGYPLP